MEETAYEHMTVMQLRALCKQRAVKLPAGIKKAQIIEKLCAQDAQVPLKTYIADSPMQEEKTGEPDMEKEEARRMDAAGMERIPRWENKPGRFRRFEGETSGMTGHLRPYRPRFSGYYNEEYGTSNPAVPQMLEAGLCADGAGILEMQPDGYGFLRADNYTPGPNDVYVSIAQIRRFHMKNGDYVSGKTRPRREGDRYSALMYVESINGAAPDEARKRRGFENLTPVHPNRRLTLENPQGGSDTAIRMVDFIAPIGLGQRALIVAPPKAGKTVLLKKIAAAIEQNHPDIHLIVLLIDERPEEVTDLKRAIEGEVAYSTFDQPGENHTRVAEMVYDRAQRLVEQGKDVVVLMDSLTRLARAYNAVAVGGRAMSGGLAPGVLQKPKKFFGAARNLEEGGSLTIIATVLVETGSRTDEIIFEEFKGTGNAEIRLDRTLSERRVFPAVDLMRSGTRREELLLTPLELEGVAQVRRVLSDKRGGDNICQLISMIENTKNNEEFFNRLKECLAISQKEAYTIRGVRSSV